MRAWKVYIDDFKHAEIFEQGEMELLETVVPAVQEKATTRKPELMEMAEDAYEESGAEGNPKKEEVGKLRLCSLGERMDGARGDRRGPKGYDQELIDLTLHFLSLPRPPKKLSQIVGGRWVRLQCIRKPTASACDAFWPWMSLPVPGHPTHRGRGTPRGLHACASVLLQLSGGNRSSRDSIRCI